MLASVRALVQTLAAPLLIQLRIIGSGKHRKNLVTYVKNTSVRNLAAFGRSHSSLPLCICLSLCCTYVTLPCKLNRPLSHSPSLSKYIYICIYVYTQIYLYMDTYTNYTHIHMHIYIFKS